MLIHEFENKDYYQVELIKNIEESKKENLIYIWINVESLDVSNFKPIIVLDMLEKEEFQHHVFE